MYFREKEFSAEAFRSPGQDFVPVYGWVWNGPLTEEKIDAQIAEMQRLGIRAFYIIPEPQSFRPAIMPTRLEPDYLTPAYFRYYRHAMDRARECGMTCWLYDEGGWPSGGACGKVLFEYPEYVRRSLRHSTRQYKAGDRYRAGTEAEAAFADGCLLEDGHVFSTDTTVAMYTSHASAWEAPGIPDYPDLTVKGATQAFLRMTHEQYKAYLGDHIGSTVTAVFTDEPKAPSLPFRAELFRLYKEMYGESILPYLPVLAGTVPLTEETIEYRRRWYDLCSRAYCENFLLECKTWANANGMRFTGHLDGEDHPLGCLRGCHFHVMRALRCMDIPGVDVIWRQIHPGEPKEFFIGGNSAGNEPQNRFFPRYASSAAAQTGGERAMTESLGVYGHGITYEQMRYVFGFQAIRGVTVMNPLLISYDREGYTMSQEAPAFAEIQGCHRDLGIFNRYLERLAYVCSCGERVCDTALYYPVNDFWGGLHAQETAETYEALGRAIEARGIDFDILDDDVILQAADIRSGVIRMGKAQYRKVAVPTGAYLSPVVADRLAQFCAGGGTVVTNAAALQPTANLHGGSSIRVMKRLTVGGELLCLFNEADGPQTFRVQTDGRRGYFADITLGKLRPLQTDETGAVTLTLASGETCALYLSQEQLSADKNFVPAHTVSIDGPYTFRRTESFRIGKRRPEYEVLNEAAVPLALGEWSGVTGRDFTGSGLYTAHFAAHSGAAVLALGDVRHSCEVFLNGQSLGVRVMKPYRFDVPDGLLQTENLLEIRVSNTPGNQHQYTESFDVYAPWQLSVYKQAQDTFDRDSLDSGLFGPVTLLYGKTEQ